MGVSTKIVEYLFGAAKGRLGVDNSFTFSWNSYACAGFIIPCRSVVGQVAGSTISRETRSIWRRRQQNGKLSLRSQASTIKIYLENLNSDAGKVSRLN